MGLGYFLTSTGATGEVQQVELANASDIDDAFELSTLSLGTTGTAFDQGIATFAPVTMEIPIDSGANSFLADAANKTTIPSVTLYVVYNKDTDNSVNQLVDQITLTNVTIAELQQGGGGTALALNYEKMTDQPYYLDGATGKTVKGTPFEASTYGMFAAPPALTPPATDSTTNSFLAVSGVKVQARTPASKGISMSMIILSR